MCLAERGVVEEAGIESVYITPLYNTHVASTSSKEIQFYIGDRITPKILSMPIAEHSSINAMTGQPGRCQYHVTG